MDLRFRNAKLEYEYYMGLEFTTYRDTFSYKVGMLDKGARIYNGLGNNGHHGDMPQWEYERRFYGIGPRLERKHFLDDYQYEDYIEWRDLRDQPKRQRWEFATEQEYKDYLELRWDVDPEIMEDVLKEYALVSRGILFGWQIYSWVAEGVQPDEDGLLLVNAHTLFKRIANTPQEERKKWMDELAFFLWTAIDNYPPKVNKILMKEEVITKEHRIYEKCLAFQRQYIKWVNKFAQNVNQQMGYPTEHEEDSLTTQNDEENESTTSLFDWFIPPEIPLYQIEEGQEENPPPDQGKIACIILGELPKDYSFDTENGWEIVHPCILREDGTDYPGTPPKGKRFKRNPNGIWLDLDKNKCCPTCVVNKHAAFIECMNCNRLTHRQCYHENVLTKHKLPHLVKEEQGMHYELYEDSTCSIECYNQTFQKLKSEEESSQKEDLILSVEKKTPNKSNQTSTNAINTTSSQFVKRKPLTESDTSSDEEWLKQKTHFLKRKDNTSGDVLSADKEIVIRQKHTVIKHPDKTPVTVTVEKPKRKKKEKKLRNQLHSIPFSKHNLLKKLDRIFTVSKQHGCVRLF